ncbi:MAG: hypothetical protein HQ461_09305, partial [Deltaproteobacteria bacterium]|nr:hypothetical protein [Deltaproteobacteria bacterium]
MTPRFTVPGLSSASLATLSALDDASLAEALVSWMLALRPVALEQGAAVAAMAGLP